MVVCSKCSAEEMETYAHAKCDECGVLLCVNCSNLSASEHKGITLKKRSPCVRYSCCECLKLLKNEAKTKSKQNIGDIEASLLKAMQKRFDEMKEDLLKNDKTEKLLKYLDSLNKAISTMKADNSKQKTKIEELTSKMLEIETCVKGDKHIENSSNKNKKPSLTPDVQQTSSRKQEKQNNGDDGNNDGNQITLSQLQRAINSANVVESNPLDDELRYESMSQEFSGVQRNNEALERSNQLVGVPNKRWYYIGQVSSKSTSQALVKYIRDKANMAVSEPVIITQLSSNSNTKSFKIGIESKYSKKLEDEDFWPPFVICKNFVFRKPGFQNGKYYNRNVASHRHFFPTRNRNLWRN
nr:unnamed protein product [Callosobruchus analis]